MKIVGLFRLEENKGVRKKIVDVKLSIAKDPLLRLGEVRNRDGSAGRMQDCSPVDFAVGVSKGRLASPNEKKIMLTNICSIHTEK